MDLQQGVFVADNSLLLLWLLLAQNVTLQYVHKYTSTDSQDVGAIWLHLGHCLKTLSDITIRCKFVLLHRKMHSVRPSILPHGRHNSIDRTSDLPTEVLPLVVPAYGQYAEN